MEEAQIKATVDTIMQNARQAFEAYAATDKNKRAAFLKEIAAQIEKKRASLVLLAMEESHLPEARLQGELTRTSNQLKMFATLIEEGNWVEAAIDNGNKERKPLPKPDTRKMLQPIGPVIVFGASNFPFAFSTAGGDTASALAAGASVVIKAHRGHTKTSRLVFEAMKTAINITGMPEHTVQHFEADSYAGGKALVQHPYTTGIGFTGSYTGGRALMQYASERKSPIPVYAEMSSINPVVLYPGCLEQQPELLADKLAASITLGMGQFCTNPGLLLAIEGAGLDTFMQKLAEQILASVPQPMLDSRIASSYVDGINAVKSSSEVAIIADAATNFPDKQERAVLAKVDAHTLIQRPQLHQEVFGPYSLIVICKNKEEVKAVLKSLGGQLTSTLMATENDMEQYRDIWQAQQSIAGRILVNDVPTGVEVCSSMVHGGPFPSTSDVHYTSVGTTAIKRWVRPVCYQGFPQQFLPDELKDDNPLKIWRLVDNEWIK